MGANRAWESVWERVRCRGCRDVRDVVVRTLEQAGEVRKTVAAGECVLCENRWHDQSLQCWGTGRISR
jgi:hypothetical protein